MEAVMANWDSVITLFKFCIITALWALQGSLLSAVLLYGLFVALPLLLMRRLSGLSVISLHMFVLAFIGLDLLVDDHHWAEGV
jgi:hypothetical protein